MKLRGTHSIQRVNPIFGLYWDLIPRGDFLVDPPYRAYGIMKFVFNFSQNKVKEERKLERKKKPFADLTILGNALIR